METKRGSGGEMSGAVQDPTSPESDELPLVQRLLLKLFFGRICSYIYSFI